MKANQKGYKMENKIKRKILFGFITLIATFFVAWLFWCPILGFFLSLIPSTAAYAWLGKIIVIIAIGYFGGISIPLVVFLVGLGITLSCNK